MSVHGAHFSARSALFATPHILARCRASTQFVPCNKWELIRVEERRKRDAFRVCLNEETRSHVARRMPVGSAEPARPEQGSSRAKAPAVPVELERKPTCRGRRAVFVSLASTLACPFRRFLSHPPHPLSTLALRRRYLAHCPCIYHTYPTCHKYIRLHD